MADFLSALQIDADWGEQLLRSAIAYDADEVLYNAILGTYLWRYQRDEEARPFLQFAAEHGRERAAKWLRELNRPLS